MRMDHLGGFAKPNEDAPFRNSLICGTPIAAEVYLRRWQYQTAVWHGRAVGHTSTINASEANEIRTLSNKSPVFHSQIMCYGSRPICANKPIVAFILRT